MLTLDEFCARELISGLGKLLFADWLGELARATLYESEWLGLWRQYRNGDPPRRAVAG